MLMKLYVQRAGERTLIGDFAIETPPRVGERIHVSERKTHRGTVLEVEHYLAPPVAAEVHVTITQLVVAAPSESSGQ